MILNEYDTYIKQKEMKNYQNLLQNIEKTNGDLQTSLKSSVFRDWFSSFLDEKHPDESGLMIVINLFFKSEENMSIVDTNNKNDATLIFINLLFETIKLAKKTHSLKKDSFESESTNYEAISTISDPQSFQATFPEEFYAIITEELWDRINLKFKELNNFLALENCTDLLNEIFCLFQILNEKLLGYLKQYFDEFLESSLFKNKFSENYMRKSCLINNFWFQKPQIKLKLIKPEKMSENYLSPLKIKQRDRILTTVNLPKVCKEYGDVTQSVCNSANISLNNKL